MNRIFTALLLVFFSFFSLTVHAQISVIPKAGLSIGNYDIDDTDIQTEPITGVTAGVGINVPFVKIPWLSVQPELNFIQKGLYSFSHLSMTFPPALTHELKSKSKTVLNFIELPLLTKVSFAQKSVKGYLNAGPSLGFVYGGKYDRKLHHGESMLLQERGKYEHFRHANRWDFGLQFGGGLGFAIGQGTLLFDARYGLGLNSHSKDYTDFIEVPGHRIEAAFYPPKQKSRTLALSCGYAYTLGK